MKNISFKARTNGKGFWSNTVAEVNIVGYELTHLTCYRNDYYSYTKLYFDNSWNTKEYGLIYTDPLFIKDVTLNLKPILKFKSIDYTENGMQGNNYVSLECDFDKKTYEELKTLIDII
jgi:hypothetical protein